MSGDDALKRLAEAVTERHRRLVIAAVLVVSLVLGAGAPAVELSTSLEQFRGGTEAAAADDYIERHMSGGEPNVTQGLVVVRDSTATVRLDDCVTELPRGQRDRARRELGNGTYVDTDRCRSYLDSHGAADATLQPGDDDVLTKQRYLAQLRAQRAILANETVNRTLDHDQRPLGLANVVAILAIKHRNGTAFEEVNVRPRPPLSEQVAAMRSLDTYQVKLYTSYALGLVVDDVDHTWPDGGPYAFVPTDYEPNGRTASAATIILSHEESTSPENLTAAQVAAGEVANEELTHTRALVIGDGIVNSELRQSSLDSLTIVGPVALVLVVGVLLYAYRDLFDAALSLLGVGLVQLWMFGYMGWAGVTFNQLFVAVPVLLMGLSIDYGLHVFMRYREERAARSEGGPPDGRAGDAREARDEPAVPIVPGMRAALGGILGALVLVTLTTATGFLSNLVSGVAPLREFGLVSAVGITSTLVVFGAFLPAVKIELDDYLTDRGYDRTERAFGTGGGNLSAVLATSIASARASPWLMVGVALLATTAGMFGAAGVDTSFEEEDLLVEETPEWTEDLPEPFAPANYTAQDNLDYVERKNIVYSGSLTEILVRGNVTRPDALDRVQAAMDRANDTEAVLEFPNKNPGTRSVLTMMHSVGRNNESFNRTLKELDTDGDYVPDRNLERVYDEFYAAAPEGAPTMLTRTDGEYVALRIQVPVNATMSGGAITGQIRASAAPVRGDGLSATATGEPVMNQAVAAQLLDTVVEALALTLLVVLLVLVAAYRYEGQEWTLGVVTLLPVAMAMTWILGTMAAFDIPFNVMTALITSFTIGIGVDYSIHVSERYAQELERAGDVSEALRRSVLGTGGALLGSAVTDIAGTVVLAFAILVPLQQFGIVTALTIAYSFLASVFVLPSLLVLWTRRYGPDVSEDAVGAGTGTD